MVISDWLIKKYASRNCIRDLRFTHHVSTTTISLIMPLRLRKHCCEYTNCHGHERRTHTYWHIIPLRTRIYIVFILGFCSPWYNRYGWLGVKKHMYLFIFISDLSTVASRPIPDNSVDKHQHFSLDNIRLRLKWNRKQLDIPMEDAAFPSGLFCVLYRTINRRTT